MKRMVMTIVAAAILLAATGARADVYPVKVECWSDSGCNTAKLYNICWTAPGYPQSIQAISCSQVASNSGGPTASCDSATCEYVGGQISVYDYLGKYCKDTGGYDAIVFCVND